MKIDQRKHINVAIGKTRSVLLNADYMMPGFAGMYMKYRGREGAEGASYPLFLAANSFFQIHIYLN